ncbi:hypothetical protein E2C01_059434 [Portunus trituberculatus]|uniref:Uncharacterized protein n=1 Tax=Portunus trituberculatus TaxID=210409 RepID=A0A5B7GY64_PORTR|nr:hypothetical protein [Portunus trituberculatus]
MAQGITTYETPSPKPAARISKTSGFADALITWIRPLAGQGYTPQGVGREEERDGGKGVRRQGWREEGRPVEKEEEEEEDLE